MHDDSVTAAPAEAVAATPATLARQAGRGPLAAALRASRRDTLATFAAYRQALPGLRVPQRPTLNPPLWELGHVGWFQGWWLARNPHRWLGVLADPEAPRAVAEPVNADALYHSSRVPHERRWRLPLPDAETTLAQLQRHLDATLALLDDCAADDASLYFFRLVLLHEDMHHEAALYMARDLGIAIDDPRWQPPSLPPPGPPIVFAPGRWTLGSGSVTGFAFDNELGHCSQDVAAIEIDAQVVRWAEYLPFVAAGGYREPRWWSDAGRSWLARSGQQAPRYLRLDGARWLEQRGHQWRPLDLAAAACHLTRHEAAAWCRWAGRRLPTEAEWERAVVAGDARLRWGDVWEWTASPFAPFPGFIAHPYRDYSAPWFDGRPVLRGASYLTQPRMRHPRYRNFFAESRNDVPAGFRSCRPVPG